MSFGWLKQHFKRKLFNMINVGTKEQVADILMKPFADKSKREQAMKLINHDRVADKLQTGGKDSDAHVVSEPHLTAAASTLTSRPPGQAEDLAAHLDMDKDFSDIALNKILTMLVQDSVRFYSLGLCPGQDRHHLTKATLKFSAVTKFLINACVRSWLWMHTRYGPNGHGWSNVCSIQGSFEGLPALQIYQLTKHVACAGLVWRRAKPWETA